MLIVNQVKVESIKILKLLKSTRYSKSYLNKQQATFVTLYLCQ